MDCIFATVDAVCRTEAIAHMGLAQIRHHTNPVVAQSLLVQLIAGALISGGVPLIATTFQLNSPYGHWQLVTPPWLQNATLLLYSDLWGGAFAAAFMSLLTSGHVEARFPWLLPLAPYLTRWLFAADKIDAQILKHVPYLPFRQAKAMGAAFLWMCLLLPVLLRRLRRAPRPPRTSRRSAKKGRKAA